MKAGDAEYDALVRKLTESKMHKVTQLSEAETAKEIADVTEGVFEQRDKNGDLIDPDAPNRTQYEATMVAMGAQEASQVITPKRRGRPKGSKNKPKV